MHINVEVSAHNLQDRKYEDLKHWVQQEQDIMKVDLVEYSGNTLACTPYDLNFGMAQWIAFVLAFETAMLRRPK